MLKQLDAFCRLFAIKIYRVKPFIGKNMYICLPYQQAMRQKSFRYRKNMKIKSLKNNQIDYKKWDECIESSKNRLVYPYSWYLDVVSPGWEALIIGDYDYIMPLPVKKRFGFNYLIQPILTQQLGIYSAQNIHKKIVKKFRRNIFFLSYEINLNYGNYEPGLLTAPNYVLKLDAAYDEIYNNYSDNTKRNLQSAYKCSLQIKEIEDSIDFIDFIFSVNKNYRLGHKIMATELIETALQKNKIILYGVYNFQNQLITALGLLKDERRLTYLMPASSEQGKSMRAMFFLIDQIIRQYAGTGTTLDFEGSKIAGIARFYRGFGASNEPYYLMRRFRPKFLLKNKHYTKRYNRQG